jgi:hypothetical protein
MKTKMIVLMLISFFVCPIGSHAAYIIHLKTGGQFVTPQYWEDKGGMITFFVAGGTMGIEKNTVQAIKRSKFDDDQPPSSEKAAPQTVPFGSEAVVKPESTPKKVDLKVYQDKMAKLKVELNKTLARMKTAEKRKDTRAKDEAMEDNRRISDEMWKITDELEKSNVKLPADWWGGIGQEAR